MIVDVRKASIIMIINEEAQRATIEFNRQSHGVVIQYCGCYWSEGIPSRQIYVVATYMPTGSLTYIEQNNLPARVEIVFGSQEDLIQLRALNINERIRKELEGVLKVESDGE